MTVAQPRQTDNVCVFEGQTFQPGESFGELFEIPRCGPWFDFPCYCNLDFDPPIDCPYCGITAPNGGLVCARQDETVSVVNSEGVLQDCECAISPDAAIGDNYLQATCRQNVPDDNNNNNDDGGTTVGGDDNIDGENDDIVDLNDVCTLDLDGSTQTFQNGQSFGNAIQTLCIDGLNFPCYCDTSLPTKIRCPYCGYKTNTGGLMCASLNETVQFISATNNPTECTCLDDASSSSSCRDLTEPTLLPSITPPLTVNPTYTMLPPTLPPSVPSIISTLAPTKPTISTTVQPSMLAPSPTTPWPTVGIDKPSIAAPQRNPIAQPASPKPSPDGCFYNAKLDDSIEFVENGKAFGDDVTGPCPHKQYPVLCNTALSGKREYPYCVFSSHLQEGISTQIDTEFKDNINRALPLTTLCARSGERVLVSRGDGSKDLCGCLYNNPAIGPISQCKMVDFNYTEVMITSSPSVSPTKAWDEDDYDNDDGNNAPTIPSSSSSFKRWSRLQYLVTVASLSLLLSMIGC